MARTPNALGGPRALRVGASRPFGPDPGRRRHRQHQRLSVSLTPPCRRSAVRSMPVDTAKKWSGCGHGTSSTMQRIAAERASAQRLRRSVPILPATLRRSRHRRSQGRDRGHHSGPRHRRRLAAERTAARVLGVRWAKTRWRRISAASAKCMRSLTALLQTAGGSAVRADRAVLRPSRAPEGVNTPVVTSGQGQRQKGIRHAVGTRVGVARIPGIAIAMTAGDVEMTLAGALAPPAAEGRRH